MASFDEKRFIEDFNKIGQGQKTVSAYTPSADAETNFNNEQFFADFDKITAKERGNRTHLPSADFAKSVKAVEAVTPEQQQNYDYMQGVISNSNEKKGYENDLERINREISAISGYGAGADRSGLAQLFKEKDEAEKRLKVGRYDEDLSALERVTLSAQGIGESYNATAGVLADTAVQAFKDHRENKGDEEYDSTRKSLNAVTSRLNAMQQRIDSGFGNQVDMAEFERLKAQQKQLDAVMDEKYRTPLDLETDSMQAMQRAMQAQSQATYGMGDGAAFLYNTGVSIADNAVLMPLAALPGGQAAILGLMGARSAAQRAVEVGQGGGTAADALVRGLSSGLIEAATEKLPLDRLVKIAKGDTGKSIIKNVLEQAGSEGTEESIAYIANHLVDIAAQDPNAEFSISELLLSFAGGAISGGVMGGGADIAGRTVDKIKSKNKGTTAADSVKQKVEDAAKMQQDEAGAAVVQQDGAEIENTDNAVNNSESVIISADNDILQSTAKNADRAALEKEVRAIVGEDTRTEAQKVAESEGERLAALEQMKNDGFVTEQELAQQQEISAQRIAQAENAEVNLEQILDIESGADSRSFNEQRKAENLLIKKLSGLFGTPIGHAREARAETKALVQNLTEEIKATGRLSEKTIDNLVNEAFDKGVIDVGGRDVSLADYYGVYSDKVKANIRKDVLNHTDVFVDRINEIANYEAAVKAKADAKKETVAKGPISLEDFYKAQQDVYSAEKELTRIENDALLTEAENQLVNALLAGADVSVVTGPRKNKIIAVYNAKKAVKDAKAPVAQYRAALRDSREETADRALETFRGWSDKGGIGLRYDAETFERNIRDIVPDRAEAQFIIDTYATPVHTAEAAATRLKNEMRERVRALNIDAGNDKLYTISFGKTAEMKVNESGLVQLLGEGLITEQQVKDCGADVAKIKKATEEFKKIYAELYKQANEALLRNGYEPMGKIENYFPHFIEEADTMLSRIAKKAGFEVQTNRLPTDIAGITDTFHPGKKFFGHSMKRTTETTAYDAIKGFDQYIEGVASVIHQTDNIQNLRTLENRLRFNAGDMGVQKALLEIDKDTSKTETEKQIERDALYETNKQSNLSGFVSYLRRYTDNLAGKKHRGDRGIEDDIGRGVYTLSKALEGRIASNMIGGNIGSALTNFIPITQATAEIEGRHLLKAMEDTMKAMRSGDSSFENDSDFLTNRFGSDRLVFTRTQELSKFAGAAMTGIDRFTSNVVVRAKYNQNLANGMNAEDAMADANSYGANLLADRSKGALPLIFERKNPLMKALTMFQTEQNNQLRYLVKDLPDALKEEGKEALLTALLKYSVGAWLYNLLYQFIVGRKPAFDPIDIGYGIVSDAADVVKGEKKASAALTENATAIVEELPFVGGLLGGGRVPISSAMPDLAQLVKLTDDEVSAAKKKQIAWDELTTPLWYLGFPVAGGQAKKLAETGRLLLNGGVEYGVEADGDKKVKFAVDTDNPLKIAQSAAFGKWSSKEAREYIDNGFKGLTVGQTKNFEMYKSWGMSNSEAFEKAKQSTATTEKQYSVMDALTAAGLGEQTAYDIATTYKAKADTDGNNSLKTAEAKAYIDKLDMTREQKAILFSCMCPDVKNNPYE